MSGLHGRRRAAVKSGTKAGRYYSGRASTRAPKKARSVKTKR